MRYQCSSVFLLTTAYNSWLRKFSEAKLIQSFFPPPLQTTISFFIKFLKCLYLSSTLVYKNGQGRFIIFTRKTMTPNMPQTPRELLTSSHASAPPKWNQVPPAVQAAPLLWNMIYATPFGQQASPVATSAPVSAFVGGPSRGPGRNRRPQGRKQPSKTKSTGAQQIYNHPEKPIPNPPQQTMPTFDVKHRC